MIAGKDISEPMGVRKEGAISGTARTVPTHVGWVRNWPSWAPYVAVAWSLVYTALGMYWAVSGHGFPLASALASGTGPLGGRFGPVVAWIIVIAAGLPAAAVGMVMLRGVRRLRSLLIVAGALLAAVLLLFMTDLLLLTMLAYIPFVIFRLITGADISFYVRELTKSGWIIAHQLFCLIGGFIWLAATISYARRSTDACLYCGRRDGPEGWTSPSKAARWGRIAVYIAMVVPIFYAATRYAWALGIPWGMTEEHLRQGQQSGTWIMGLFLANVGLVGAVLMLGLVQRWGEVFPRWMIGLAGRRVPIALAVVPASIMSVLFVVTGISILSEYNRMAKAAVIIGEDMWISAGPTFFFPLWGAALAVATLGYYFRRRGPCGVCGCGIPGNPGKPLTNHDSTDHVL